jgi:hypothetical protein
VLHATRKSRYDGFLYQKQNGNGFLLDGVYRDALQFDRPVLPDVVKVKGSWSGENPVQVIHPSDGGR